MGWSRSKAISRIPTKSEIFSKYPAFLKDHHVRDFVCDTLRMATTRRH